MNTDATDFIILIDLVFNNEGKQLAILKQTGKDISPCRS